MDDSEVRPEEATDEVLEYLDDLRDSGVTNMFGAGAYLREDFGYSVNQSMSALAYWMHTFGDRHPK